jgi:hypothetical protein
MLTIKKSSQAKARQVKGTAETRHFCLSIDGKEEEEVRNIKKYQKKKVRI